MKGKNDPTIFLPLKSNLGGPIWHVKDRENICLTLDQARYIYKKVEWDSIVNVETIKQEIEDDRLGKDNDNKEEENPYQNVIINEFDRNNIITSQMEQWSLPSNIVNCVQYDRNPRDYYNLEVKALEQKNHRKIYYRLKEEDKQIIELYFGDTPDKLKEEYLDMYDAVRSEVLCNTKFDQNSD